jgi:transposase
MSVTPSPYLFVSLELCNKKWHASASDGGTRICEHTVEAGDGQGLLAVVERARTRLHLGKDVPIVSCYEAGRDGFWLHRFLEAHGIRNHVVDSASIEVNRRQRRAKTDRLDGRKLLSMLVRFVGGEKKVWAVLRVPSEVQEDERRPHRERARLVSLGRLQCRPFIQLGRRRGAARARKPQAGYGVGQYGRTDRRWITCRPSDFHAPLDEQRTGGKPKSPSTASTTSRKLDAMPNLIEGTDHVFRRSPGLAEATSLRGVASGDCLGKAWLSLRV